MIKANSKSELLSILSSEDITVPPRHKGRTTNHTEKYCLFKMLATLAQHKLLKYPIEIVNRERPDFVFKACGQSIGIEQTEAVPENLAKQDFLRGKMGKNEVHFISKHHPKEAKKTTKQLKHEINNTVPSGGWVGDSVEVNWSEAMVYFIEKKEINGLKAGYASFDENSLLIYDNWPTAALDVDIGAKYLAKRLNEHTSKYNFDKIYILSHGYLLVFKGSSFEKYTVNELWQSS
ncbi:hypothetical protein [Kangiella taiwanensis]|uniref:Uncharacterized protein n=1 Tax=Kangiella taiwanensis TaxID=1079179 RepID=A0ABP8HUI0_9GAMM|nr:hypothetical protein [Kangiella taiwanensis]